MREYPGRSSLNFSGRGDAALSSEATGESRAIKITIWDSRSGALLRTLNGTSSSLRPGGHVRSIAISPDDSCSPDDSWIVSGNTDRSIRFWNATSDDPKRTFFGHAQDVLSLAFSPDGKQLASGGADKMVHVWSNLP
jgi:WD40 repeat protein